MAHGRTGPDIVANIRYVGMSAIRAVSDHERNRTPDGVSAIDPKRSVLNKLLVGTGTQIDALDELWKSGVKRPAKQSETPFVQMVLSASPAFFREAPQGPGEWNDDRMSEWRDATLAWLKSEYGADLVHVSLHLDEDTPHMHALVVPTYEKSARKPGRKKRGESDADFDARRSAAAAAICRAAGRSSCEQWSRPFARRYARQSYHKAVENLGLGYGRDFIEESQPSPGSVPTGAWVREKAADLAIKDAQMEAARIANDAEGARLIRDAEVEARKLCTDANTKAAAIIAVAEEARLKAEAQVRGLEAVVAESEAGTLRRNQRGGMTAADPKTLQAGGQSVARAARALISIQEKTAEANVVLERVRQRENSAILTEARALEREQEADSLVMKLKKVLGRVTRLLSRPDLPVDAAVQAHHVLYDAEELLPAKEPHEETGPGF